MDKEKLVKYWITASELDLPTIDHLFEKGDYVWSLFIAHLVLEKILKAHYSYNQNTMAPKTHDLIKLAKLSDIKLEAEQWEFLDLANDFNIEARYPEEKFDFYKICTKEFTSDNIKIVKEMYKWLRSQLPL